MTVTVTYHATHPAREVVIVAVMVAAVPRVQPFIDSPRTNHGPSVHRILRTRPLSPTPRPLKFGTVASMPQRNSASTGCLYFSGFQRIRDLTDTSTSGLSMVRVGSTLIMICDESWPPSGDVRFPGRPADSQFEQMSTASHTAQWNRAPTISSMQLSGSRLFALVSDDDTHC